MEKFSNAGEEIHFICEKLGIDLHELSRRSGVNYETLRKVANHGQKISEVRMSNLRRVLFMADYFKDAPREASHRPYRFMETDLLQKGISDLSRKLCRAIQQDRKHIMGNLRQMLDELEEREISSFVPAHTPSIEKKRVPVPREIDDLTDSLKAPPKTPPRS
jgi:hypothetical protein